MPRRTIRRLETHRRRRTIPVRAMAEAMETAEMEAPEEAAAVDQIHPVAQVMTETGTGMATVRHRSHRLRRHLVAKESRKLFRTPTTGTTTKDGERGRGSTFADAVRALSLGALATRVRMEVRSSMTCCRRG